MTPRPKTTNPDEKRSIMEAPVLNAENKQVGTRTLDEAVFGAPVNEALLWEVVRMQEACRRQGTHDVKNRGAVAGSGT